IVIRMARKTEKIILKSGEQIDLDESILVLSDSEKILSIPGNINSDIVDIDKNSTNIFLSTILIDQKNIINIRKKFNINKYLEYYR
ncbi:B3/4 domain-containing protein, partial [Buchnera aphidicola]|nr:B3/4 domain-containing protein [Buchnera aphidicola]